MDGWVDGLMGRWGDRSIDGSMDRGGEEREGGRYGSIDLDGYGSMDLDGDGWRYMEMD